VDERNRFIDDALSDRFIMSELCARYGVSRRVGYKWLARFAEEGRRGLRDRSRAPHHCPHRIRPELAELLCAFRREHPYWGARKLLRILSKRHRDIRDWPAPSTTAESPGPARLGAAAPAAATAATPWRRRAGHPGAE
jgi:transposase